MSKLTSFRGGRRAATLAGAMSLGVLTLALVTSPVMAATTTPFNTNIVKNQGAESGAASSNGNAGVTIPNWEEISDSNFTVVKYGTSGFPSVSAGHAVLGGAQFFTSGVYDSIYGGCDDSIQNIKIKGRNSLIDGHHVSVTLSAFLAKGPGNDKPIVLMTFGDSTNNSTGNSIQIGSTSSSFSQKSKTVLLPKHTRQVTVKLEDYSGSGPYCRAYFDNVSVRINQV